LEFFVKSLEHADVADDIWGDHALTCKSGGGIVFRHHLVLKVLYSFALDAGLDPRKELEGYKLNAKDRIGDLQTMAVSVGIRCMLLVLRYLRLFHITLPSSQRQAHKSDLDDQQMIDTVARLGSGEPDSSSCQE
jgi:hypothetical protein